MKTAIYPHPYDNSSLEGATKLTLCHTCLTMMPSFLSLDSVMDYFKLALAGLAGSTHMVSATITALARLVYEFHGKL